MRSITLKHLNSLKVIRTMMSTDSHSPSEIQEILRLKNVAIVGMSNTDGKPANFVSKYLIENGYNVIPVNPTTKEVLGKKSYAVFLRYLNKWI
jgi:predicted CoA-binding protein